MDCPGGDFEQFSDSNSVADCKQRCDADDRCRIFTWVKDWKSCNLKEEGSCTLIDFTGDLTLASAIKVASRGMYHFNLSIDQC